MPSSPSTVARNVTKIWPSRRMSCDRRRRPVSSSPEAKAPKTRGQGPQRSCEKYGVVIYQIVGGGFLYTHFFQDFPTKSWDEDESIPFFWRSKVITNTSTTFPTKKTYYKDSHHWRSDLTIPHKKSGSFHRLVHIPSSHGTHQTGKGKSLTQKCL